MCSIRIEQIENIFYMHCCRENTYIGGVCEREHILHALLSINLHQVYVECVLSHTRRLYMCSLTIERERERERELY